MNRWGMGNNGGNLNKIGKIKPKGWEENMKECIDCKGTGKTPKGGQCPKCEGTGTEQPLFAVVMAYDPNNPLLALKEKFGDAIRKEVEVKGHVDGWWVIKMCVKTAKLPEIMQEIEKMEQERLLKTSKSQKEAIGKAEKELLEIKRHLEVLMQLPKDTKIEIKNREELLELLRKFEQLPELSNLSQEIIAKIKETEKRGQGQER